MARFMILHCGFEKPTKEIMAKWNTWFEETKSATQNMGRFLRGVELTHDGETSLPFAAESISGFSIIEADDLEAAKEIAARNPFVRAIRVYAIS